MRLITTRERRYSDISIIRIVSFFGGFATYDSLLRLTRSLGDARSRSNNTAWQSGINLWGWRNERPMGNGFLTRGTDVKEGNLQ